MKKEIEQNGNQPGQQTKTRIFIMQQMELSLLVVHVLNLMDAVTWYCATIILANESTEWSLNHSEAERFIYKTYTKQKHTQTHTVVHKTCTVSALYYETLTHYKQKFLPTKNQTRLVTKLTGMNRCVAWQIPAISSFPWPLRTLKSRLSNKFISYSTRYSY